jgi:hypothetical protein
MHLATFFYFQALFFEWFHAAMPCSFSFLKSMIAGDNNWL